MSRRPANGGKLEREKTEDLVDKRRHRLKMVDNGLIEDKKALEADRFCIKWLTGKYEELKKMQGEKNKVEEGPKPVKDKRVK